MFGGKHVRHLPQVHGVVGGVRHVGGEGQGDDALRHVYEVHAGGGAHALLPAGDGEIQINTNDFLHRD